MAATATQVDYGLDSAIAVRQMFSRCGWTLAFALVIFFINRAEYPGPAARLLLVLGLIAAAFAAAGVLMMRASRVARFEIRDRILDALELNGEERVLDLGCGAGLMSIAAAKRLKSGRVTAVDFSGGADKAKENAKLDGVAEKIRVDSSDNPKLVYPDNHFDVAVSVLALRELGDSDVRGQLLRETLRVLKPGGRLAIFDTLYVSDYAETLRAAGAQNVELSPMNWYGVTPARTVTARK